VNNWAFNSDLACSVIACSVIACSVIHFSFLFVHRWVWCDRLEKV